MKNMLLFADWCFFCATFPFRVILSNLYWMCDKNTHASCLHSFSDANHSPFPLFVSVLLGPVRED